MEKALQLIEQRAELRRLTREKIDAIQAESARLAAAGVSPGHSVEVELADGDRPVEMAKMRSSDAISAMDRSRKRINELETELKQLESAQAFRFIVVGFVTVIVAIIAVIILAAAA